MDMRLLASVLLTVLASFGIVVTGGAGPALACSCAFQRVPEYVAYADAVFVGTLVEIGGPPKRQVMSSTDPVTYMVAVDWVYQGDVGAVAVFESAMSGASCGLDGMVVDRRYVFFTTAKGGVSTASSCGGTAPVTPRRLAAVQRLLGDPTTPSVAVDEAVRIDDDVASSSGAPGWPVAEGLVGVVALLAAGLCLRRRSA
jgi:hypothetical protein